MDLIKTLPLVESRFHCREALLPQGWAKDVAIAVDPAGNVASVAADVQPEPTDRRLRGVVIPGVPNVHSHAHQRAMAGLAEYSGAGDSGGGSGDSFWTWREVMYSFLGRMGPEDLQAIAAQLYVENLKAGFTAIGEFQYLHHGLDGTPYENLAEMTLRCYDAARETGLGFTALPVLYADGNFGGQAPSQGQRRFLNDGDRFLRLLESVRHRLASDGNASWGVAPHSLRAVGPTLLRNVLKGIEEAWPDEAVPVHIHIAEQLKEVNDCLAWSGQRPVEWLLDHIELSPRWCAIHATHMTSQEAQGLAKTGAVAGLCPTTEANLGDGIFPAPDFLEAGGAIAIGSDSHISVSPAEDLRMLEYGQRLRDHARNVLASGPNRSTGRSLLDRAWSGGAQALARPLGRIAPSYRADLVVLDDQHPALVGRSGDALLDSWIFSGGDSCVQDVVVGGRQAVEQRHHANEGPILQRFSRALNRLKH